MKTREEEILCPVFHKPMILQNHTKMSAEQRWCGIWYECKDYTTCRRSVLIPSAELLALHERLRVESAQQSLELVGGN
jgi:hypothetical protein